MASTLGRYLKEHGIRDTLAAIGRRLRRFELREGDVYGSDFFLLERRRGNNVATDFVYKMESALSERGYGRVWGHVVSDNRPARWIYSTRDNVPMWKVQRTKVLTVQRVSREPLVTTEVAA